MLPARIRKVSRKLHTYDYRCPLFNECSSCFETLVTLFQQCYSRSGEVAQHVLSDYFQNTYRLERILVHSGVAQWLKLSPVVGRFACPRAATK